MRKKNKKSKNKERLDKYFYLAKEQGYRSRAAFKLIQLNRKYDLLSNVNTIVDLCAAPGGWLQVCRKFTPVSTTIIGVDLTAIKSIPHVKTLVGNITFKNTFRKIRNEIRGAGQKADLIIHDGAPNMGANWIQDAFTQNELVLSSLKLCVEILRKGGTFVTKVFRSRDYMSLIFVLREFFSKVEVTKPDSSRKSSAEVYVLCFGYKDPKNIDGKLLDMNYVFKEIKPKKSLKQYLKMEKNPKKRNRSGYEEEYSTFYKTIFVKDFVTSETPIINLMECSEIAFTNEKNDDEINAIINHEATTKEIRTLCNDLKIIDRSDFRRILKWRIKMIKLMKNMERNDIDDLAHEGMKLRDEMMEDVGEAKKINLLEELNIDDDDKLLSELNKYEDKEKRKRKKDIEKTLLRRRGKLPQIDELFENTSDAVDTLYNDTGLFSLKNIKSKKDLENVYYSKVNEIDPILRSQQKKVEEMEQEELNALEISNKYVFNDEEYDLEIENDFDKLYNEYNKERTKHQQMRDKEFNENLKRDKETLYNLIEEEKMELEIDNDFMKESNPLVLGLNENKKTSLNPKEKWFSQDVFNDIQNVNVNVDEDERDEDEEDRPRKKRLLNDGSKGNVFLGGKNLVLRNERMEEFEEIPKEMYDPEIGSTTLAIGKKLLRKKERNEWIDGAYNRYSFNDTSDLPQWFRDDYNQNTMRELPVTKEEIEAQKKKFEELNIRPTKKIAEAEFRKKRKLYLKRKSMVKKANQIAKREDLTNTSKIMALQKVYGRYSSKKKDKIYVTPKKGKGVKRKRGMKVIRVDKRMKSDKRGKDKIKRK